MSRVNGVLWVGLVDERIMGGKTDETKLSEHLAMLEAKLDAYEIILSKRPYIGGSVRPPTSPFYSSHSF